VPERRQVIDIAPPPDQPSMRTAFETLRETVGLSSSLASIPLVMSEAGVAVVGAVDGTAVVMSRTVVDFEDARIDQMRLCGWAGANGANCSIRVVDLTGSTVVLCTVALVNGAATWVQGSWTLVEPPTLGGGSRKVALQCVGNGALTQTVHHAELQMRSFRHFRR